MPTLKILSYNIRQHNLSKSKKRAKALVERLNAEPLCDVICLQEVFDESARKILRKGLQNNFPFQKPKSGTEIPDWIPILGWFDEDSGLFFASRYPFNESDGKIMHAFERFSDPGRQTTDFISKKGIFTASLDVNGKDILVFNTHLQSGEFPAIRENQLRQIQSCITRKSLKWSEIREEPGAFHGDFSVIIVGDFNIDETLRSEEYKNMTTRFLHKPRDLYRELRTDRGASPGFTWGGQENSLFPRDSQKRLDYIISFDTIPIPEDVRPPDGSDEVQINRVALKEIEVVKYKDEEDNDLSDHYAVVAEIEI